MIDIQKDTPIEYSKQSRDYQVFRFLYTVLFNQLKMHTDQIKNIWTDNVDSKLLDLRAYTLNFIPKYQWENSDLLGVTNCFRYLVRSKGTKGAIEGCLEILARVKGISLTGVNVKVDSATGIVQLIISEEIDDVGNIEDLLRYILPAGCLYEIIKYSRLDSSLTEDIVVDDELSKKAEYKSKDLWLPNDSEGYKIPLQNLDYSTGMLVGDSENDPGN